jgi:ketosteroid isomerase-like protein
MGLKKIVDFAEVFGGFKQPAQPHRRCSIAWKRASISSLFDKDAFVGLLDPPANDLSLAVGFFDKSESDFSYQSVGSDSLVPGDLGQSGFLLGGEVDFHSWSLMVAGSRVNEQAPKNKDQRTRPTIRVTKDLHSSHARCVGMGGIRLSNNLRLSNILRSFESAPATLALTLMLALAGPTFAQATDNPLHTASRTELDVVKVVLAQEKAWNAGDIEGYAKGYKDSPDTIFIGRQISRGYAQMLDEYKHNYPTKSAMGTLSFSELEVHGLSDTFAICLGKYHLDRSKKDGGAADGLFSLVLEKTDKGWKIVLDHTT